MPLFINIFLFFFAEREVVRPFIRLILIYGKDSYPWILLEGLKFKF
jgi:hypothetical protein